MVIYCNVLKWYKLRQLTYNSKQQTLQVNKDSQQWMYYIGNKESINYIQCKY
jgi:hypothetical protein